MYLQARPVRSLVRMLPQAQGLWLDTLQHGLGTCQLPVAPPAVLAWGMQWQSSQIVCKLFCCFLLSS